MQGCLSLIVLTAVVLAITKCAEFFEANPKETIAFWLVLLIGAAIAVIVVLMKKEGQQKEQEKQAEERAIRQAEELDGIKQIISVIAGKAKDKTTQLKGLLKEDGIDASSLRTQGPDAGHADQAGDTDFTALEAETANIGAGFSGFDGSLEGAPVNYKYKVVQIPPGAQAQRNEQMGQAAARFLEIMLNEQAAAGWEFYRVDRTGALVNHGCLGFFMGRKQAHDIYYVAIFRRPAD